MSKIWMVGGGRRELRHVGRKGWEAKQGLRKKRGEDTKRKMNSKGGRRKLYTKEWAESVKE